MDIDGAGGGRKPVLPEPKPPAAKGGDGTPSRATGDAVERVPVARPNPIFGGPTATATPTAAPAVPPAAGPVYWGGLTEAQLAAFQQAQRAGRNDCADYSVAAVFNMLEGGAVRGSDVAQAADLGNVLYGYRLWSNGPTTPAQAANLVNAIADRAGLPFSAAALRATTTADLVAYLRQPDTAVIVTIGWDDSEIPDIARTSDTANRASGGAPLQINAHAMVLAAYDPGHDDRNGNPAPWGFVNSWADGGTEIFWMSDADFQRAWNHEIPLVGPRNAVVITRGPAGTSTATLTPTPAPVATPPSPARTPTPRR